MNITLMLTAEMLVLGKKVKHRAALRRCAGTLRPGGIACSRNGRAAWRGCHARRSEQLPKARIIAVSRAARLSAMERSSSPRGIGRRRQRLTTALIRRGLPPRQDRRQGGEGPAAGHVHANGSKLATAMGYIEQAFGLTDTPLRRPSRSWTASPVRRALTPSRTAPRQCVGANARGWRCPPSIVL